MSKRLDQEREKTLSPVRMNYALGELNKLGLAVTKHSETEIRFTWKGSVIKLFPYSGWFTGKTVTDGRGIRKLLNQLKTEQR